MITITFTQEQAVELLALLTLEVENLHRSRESRELWSNIINQLTASSGLTLQQLISEIRISSTTFAYGEYSMAPPKEEPNPET